MTPTIWVKSAYQSDIGWKKENNEDFVTLFEPENPDDLLRYGRLYIVADGVGGASKGEKASQYAAKKVLFEFFRNPDISPEERLSTALRHANYEIFHYAEESIGHSRMATTLVAAAVLNDRLVVANVGDSRAYLIRDGKALQITRDHSLVQEMIDNGSLTPEEAKTSKLKNRLVRSVGGEPEVDVDTFTTNLYPGDRLLLCSDGLHRYTTDTTLTQLFSTGSPEQQVNKAIDFARKSGGADNISCILVEISSTPINLQPHDYTENSPEEVDLKTLVPQKRQRKRRLDFSISRSTQNLMIVGVLLLAALVGLSAWRLATASQQIQNTPISVITSEKLLVDTPTPATSLASDDPTVITSTPFTPESRSEGTSFPRIGMTLPPTIQITNSLISNERPGECVYKPGDGEYLSKIFQAFGRQEYPNPYEYYRSCETSNDGLTQCMEKLQENNVDIVTSKRWIIITEVDNATCLNHQGLWHIQTEP